MDAPALSTGRVMANRWKIDPRSISMLQPMMRRDRPVTGEDALRRIELWVLAMVIVVVVAMSFGRAHM